MSLTNRLSLYFLSALAVVLIGFSLTLYLLARMHLYGQLLEHLQSSMKTLVAAVEVHEKDVQWEPLERRITLGEDTTDEQPRWAIHDFSGQLKDHSFNLTQTAVDDQKRYGWYMLSRRMRAGVFLPEEEDGKRHAVWLHSLNDSSFRDATVTQLDRDRTFASEGLILTVAISEAPVLGILHWLVVALVSVSLAVWIIAAFWGRWLCRRALEPIVQMSSSARSIRLQAAADQIVEVPSTGDELEGLGNAFNELLAELRQALERQRRFTGDASHQLRTPLTAMLASVEVILRQERTSPEYQRVLQIVKRRGEQLRQIIESLLVLARGDASTPLASPERIELNQWCKSYLETWDEHPRSSDITLHPSLAPAFISTHPGLLAQILNNLIDNACKYSESGTPIRVDVETTPSHVAVIVSDSGAGIADDQHAMIFEPFYRGTDSRWKGNPGVGLGLAVVNQLAKTLAAKLEVVSKLGKGSQFKVSMDAIPHESIQHSRQCEELSSTA